MYIMYLNLKNAQTNNLKHTFLKSEYFLMQTRPIICLGSPIPLSCIQNTRSLCFGVGDLLCHSPNAFYQGASPQCFNQLKSFELSGLDRDVNAKEQNP